ncbi:FtsX-like permease family protein [Granulicella sp. 5B5]|uniref:ABC transporter permease n=1 Tax=Granulicella sp. 5B5 TaxID=1617967 RepID=UPI0015F71FC9|nr:ABC transporter permease [Granulicella sp. 5B5]QMV18869.1 FtsX-like permease family protein [Granulicella sp. 5B5]
MEKKEALMIALQSLWANKLRSVLTMLGVIIAVGSLIAVVTLINGANSYVANKINNQGADVFTISQQPAFTTSYKEYVKYQKRKIISMDQYKTLQQECTECKQVGALQSTAGSVKYKAQLSTGTQIRGYTSEMPEMQNLNIIEGRSFTPADDQHGAHVALIGYDIYENLLKFEDPMGKEIRVDGVPYTIIGLGEKQGKTLGQSQDNWVGVPLTTFQKTYGAAKTLTIYAKAPSGADAMEAASDQARLLMRELRHDRPGEEDSFTLETSDALAGLFAQISNSIGAVAIAIAAISLVVGGVVIMNIMLVSVTERTREIGVRKALGAKQADLLLQFLMESATLSLIGGVFGVALGIGAALGVSAAVGFPATVALWSVLVGLFVALGVGVFFGVYPARKAAALDPIVALRSEF